MSNSLRPHGLQHARPQCPSPTPGVYLNSCPLSQWCHPTISSSVVLFSSRLQPFPASGSFQMSQFFASGGQNIAVSAVRVLHSICQQIWKTQQWPQDWKRSVFISIPKKGNPKECSNYRTIAFISHASKVMLKILQPRLQQYMNHEVTDVQAVFRKGRGTRDQIANIHWIIEKKQESSRKTSISALLTMPKPLTMWITTNCGKLFFFLWEILRETIIICHLKIIILVSIIHIEFKVQIFLIFFLLFF